jgi:murein DD-endopeptidase MepM/ murein hydrolase activator NlpD
VIPPTGYVGPESFLCLLPPEIGYLTDVYGAVRDGGWVHKGVDYGSYYQEVPVRTPFGGQVVFAGWSGPYGNLMVIENAGYRVYLAHHSSLVAYEGQVVSAGDIVGISGTTGNSSGIHVHFEVRVWDGSAWVPVDPNAVLLPGQNAYCDWYALANP